MLLYSLLYLSGYSDISLEDLKKFRQLGSKTAGHPEYGHINGIETTTGPLGQGLANAVGMALAERLLNNRFGNNLIDHYTYAIVGDGCLMEGISQEAISLAGNLCLSKLVILFDDNNISIDGPTELTVNDDQIKRFSASGWDVQSVDGHHPESISKAILKAKNSNQPSLISCKTIIGYGAPNKEGTAGTHGAPLGEDEIDLARKKLDWPYKPFEIPEKILSSWRALSNNSLSQYDSWLHRLNTSATDKQTEFKRVIEGDLPIEWVSELHDYKKSCLIDRPKLATRKASGEVLDILTRNIPELLGGSADLTGSVNTKTASTDPISAKNFQGRYIYYGVREHAMAAVMNGISLHGGFIPYGGTFLVFSDYMRGAMRLSSLMKKRVIYVLTHDSIGLGEDGPTHQAVETLANLRALPNFNLYRPCDPVETAECWELALKTTKTPSGIVLTRQSVPTLRKDANKKNLCARGGYVLSPEEGGERVVSILATGSEVQIGLEAKSLLEEIGYPTAVISLPCWELFDEQDELYKAATIGTPKLCVGVEAATRFGWDKYIGKNGIFIGMNNFGASAPGHQLFEYFGINSTEIVKAVKARL